MKNDKKNTNLDKFTVGQFDSDLLAVTKDAWLTDAVALDVSPLDYEQDLEWAESRIDYGDTKDSLAYAITCDAGKVAAILEVFYTPRPGPAIGWLKMMKVKLAPQYAPAQLESDPEKLALLPWIYSAAIIGTVELTGAHRAKVIKLYGRETTLLTMLIGLKESLEQAFKKSSTNAQIQMEGRWLVISIA